MCSILNLLLEIGHTDNCKKVIKACQDLQSNHDIGTSHRSETNEAAKRDVCNVKEGMAKKLWCWRAVARVHRGRFCSDGVVERHAQQSSRFCSRHRADPSV